jgi:putative N-acetylmannosamine-6-phosphate epimerase
MIKPGIIISLQGFSRHTTSELAREIKKAGAVAIQTDKMISSPLPLIGFRNITNVNKRTQPCRTPSIKEISEVKEWAYIVAIDYRLCNTNLLDISKYCRGNNISVVACIQNIDDYENIIENDYSHDFINTFFSIYANDNNKQPDIELVKDLRKLGCENIIAEGNYSTIDQARTAYNYGARNVCIGNAITNMYAKVLEFTEVKFPRNDK